jgi:hexosaminidase
MHAEAALTLIAHARASAGPNPTGRPTPLPEDTSLYDSARYGTATSGLREPDAVDAMELGARRMDFIGLKFQLADEMSQDYAKALADCTSTDRKVRASVGHDLGDMNSVNGRMQDIRYGYTLLRDLFESAWLRSNRPYWLRNNLELYDHAAQIWLDRADQVHSAQRQWTDSKTLPSAAELGIPLPAASPVTSTQPVPASYR